MSSNRRRYTFKMRIFLLCSLLILALLFVSIESRHTTYDDTPHVSDNELERNHTLSGRFEHRSYSYSLDTFLGSSSVLYGLIGQSSSTLQIGHTCYNHLQTIFNGIHRRDIWAMKMLDASATPEPGFVWGNNFWLGSRKQCESIQERKHITLSSRFRRNMKDALVDAPAPIPVDYRVIYVEHSSPWQIEAEFLVSPRILHLGVCVPASCGNYELQELSQSLLNNSQLEMQNLLVHQAKVILVKDLVLPDTFYQKTSIKIVGLFLVFTVVMVTLAACYENGTGSKKKPQLESFFVQTDNSIGRELKPQCNDTSAANCSQVLNNKRNTTETSNDAERDLTFSERFVRCFSLRDNFKSITATNSPPSSIPTLNAFKGIGCFIIFSFHFVWYSLYTNSNSVEVFVLGEQLLWQWVSTAPLIVDIFFTISGLLLAYNFLRNDNKCNEIRANSLWQNAKVFGKQFIHRYLRLTPLYLTVLGGTEITMSYLVAKSPFWIRDRIDLSCQQNWWRNALYIQNLDGVEGICANWSWSMACEMQFYLLCSVLLFVYVKYPIAARNIFISLFAGCTILLAVVSWNNKFTPAYDVMHSLGQEMYTSPWVRVIPYFIGLITGWYLQSTQGQPLLLSKKTVNLLWTLATTFIIMCHIVTIIRNISYVLAVPIVLAVRLFYTTSVSWMIIACVKGHGGWFATFTNYPFFAHLNKLSYGIYLLNPTVIIFIYGMSNHSVSMEPIIQTTTAIGITVIVYLLAFVFSLLFEVPYTKLSVEILRGKRKIKST